MDRFNGGSYGNATRVITFHSSSQWNPRLEATNGGSYTKALHLSQWKAPSDNFYGVSYEKATRVIEFHSLSQWKAHFEASKQNNKLMVIYFTAAWCVPCRTMEPAINDMASKFTDVEFIKIDADKLMSVSMQFGVQTMPTFILLKNGREVDKVVAAKKEELQMKIAKHRVQAYY